MGLQNYQIYPREFFSGSDVYIMFNDTLIDQIIDLEFEMVEEVSPIFGYASYTYDALARGSRIITGSFKINFVESMYLYSVLNSMGERVKVEELKPVMDRELTSEQIAHIMTEGNSTSMDRVKEFSEANKKKFWGEIETEPINKYKRPYFKNYRDTPSNQEGFDIIISYGDKNFHKSDVMNLDDMPSTLEVINGVQLYGISKVIQSTGDAIYEKYTFMAQDLNNTLGILKGKPNRKNTVNPETGLKDPSVNILPPDRDQNTIN